MNESLTELFRRWFDGEAGDEERLELMKRLHVASDAELEAIMRDRWQQLHEPDAHIGAERMQAALRSVLQGEEAKPQRETVFLHSWRAIAAAVLALLVAGAAWMWTHPGKKADVARDVQPGRNGAILTLADGSQIVLDSLRHGLVATQRGAAVTLSEEGLAYNEAANGDEIAFNTIATPIGRQFHLRLEDGTEVSLNAGSSLRYPVRFAGSSRRVTLQGEGYFRVAKDPERPFIVDAAGMDVRAVGTEFNINAYTDELQVLTTLVEGAVIVKRGADSLRLQPGEQSRLAAGRLHLLADANIDEVIAWKDGNFYFENSTLPVILRQFARWYGVEVVIEGAVDQRRQYFGMISRSASLSSVLELLEKGGVAFRIEGKKLIVQPNN
ncbi:FecR family protein [Chitinophaga lutea]